MARMASALRERLGDEAAVALEEYVDSRGLDWREEVVQTSIERFDHRLAATSAVLRLEMADTRLEMQKGFAGIWRAMADLKTSITGELTDTRVELLRWSFMFWVGQVAAIAALLAFMLRGLK